jgi:hypothetical protein
VLLLVAVNKVKIKKSELKQIIKEELEATIDEGFLDRMMGRGKKSTLLYIPEQSIQEIDFSAHNFSKNPTEPIRAEAYVALVPPRGGSTGSEKSIFVGVELYGDGDSEYEFRERRRTLNQIKKLYSNFMVSDSNQPGGFDKISAESLADTIRADVRAKAEQQADKQALDNMDAEDRAKLPQRQRNQGYQFNEEAALDERVRDRDGSGGSGFAGDSRNRTPEQEKAHQAKVRAMRAKEPKTERQLAAAWLAKPENKEVEEQIHDLAMKADMSGKADYRQVFDDKTLELYRQSVK